MSPAAPSRDDVLDAFAVEPSQDRTTLERYLQAYPQFAGELIDLSRELARVPRDHDLTEADHALIDKAWQLHAQAASVQDPFAHLSPAELRDVANRLAVPRQVITAFREHRVLLASVPAQFQQHLAQALNSTVDVLRAALSAPRVDLAAHSYKADHKPSADQAVTFERLLVDAGVDDARRAELLSGGT